MKTITNFHPMRTVRILCALVLATGVVLPSAFAHGVRHSGSGVRVGITVGNAPIQVAPRYPSVPHFHRPPVVIYSPPPVIYYSPPTVVHQHRSSSFVINSSSGTSYIESYSSFQPYVAPPPGGVTYYCDNPEGFHPYVRDCRQGWRQISP